MGDRLDYRASDVWDRLDDSFGARFEPRPSAHVGHVTCGPGWSWRFHLRDFDLWLVSQGRGRGVVAGRDVVVEPGTLLVLRPGDAGSLTQDPTDRLTVTYAHFDLVDPATGAPVLLEPEWLPGRCVRLTDVRAVHQPLLEVVRLLQRGDALGRLEARVTLAQAMVRVYRQDAESSGAGPRTTDPRVQAVQRYVRDRPSERPSLGTAAAVARTSPGYLRRLFAQETGMSFRAFCVRSRMERARELLTGSPMSVGEVARALGYADGVLFSRQVRRHFGMSPTELRRRG